MTRSIGKHAITYGCLILLVLTGILSELSAQKAERVEPEPPDYPEVTIPNTELRTIRSHIVDQEFNIYVQLPSTYFTDSTTIYPTLYVTDANRAFPLVANISTVLTYPNGKLPEIVVVGIGYPIEDMSEWAAWRTRDLTPTHDTNTDNHWNTLLAKLSHRTFDVRSGGASKFLDFIIHELIPFIESHYHVSRSDRGLAGYSYGGLFALYALFTHPETFRRFFAGSPSVEFHNDVIFKYAEDFAAVGQKVKAKVFLSVGGMEDSSTIAGTKRMTNILLAQSDPGGQVSLQLFDGEDHRSCMAAAIMRAFRVLYGQ